MVFIGVELFWNKYLKDYFKCLSTRFLIYVQVQLSSKSRIFRRKLFGLQAEWMHS